MAAMDPRMRMCIGVAAMTLAATLWAWPAASRARGFQPVAKVSCPNGEFIVDARPFAPNEAGSSAVDIRYRYRGADLAAIDYERYYSNLVPYLRDEEAPVRDLGLHLDTSGLAHFGGSGYDRGDTLYVPPSSFSRPDFDSLAECVGNHQATLRDDFARADIAGSYFLGLLQTHSGVARTGIARLVHGEAPLVGIYGDAWYVILVERTGRVLLHTTLTADSRSESVLLGQSEKDRHGRSLGDDYDIVPP